MRRTRRLVERSGLQRGSKQIAARWPQSFGVREAMNRVGSRVSNHPIEVAELLSRVGGVRDLITLQGVILHDTIEDTGTTPEELEPAFGPQVRDVVAKVTDDNRLSKAERKCLQIEHAPHLSERARQIKLADKISNVRAVTQTPPADWPLARRREYLDWT